MKTRWQEMAVEDSGVGSRTVLVTGAAQGVGYGIAEKFASAGYRVVVADRNGDGADAASARLREQGCGALGLELDVTDEASVQSCVTNAVRFSGGIDVLVNNAGVHSERIGEPSTVEQFQRCYDVNLLGLWRMTLATLPALRASEGRIVNIASINGLQPWADTPGYSASKAAVINLTRSMAVKLGDDSITVNAVCPGSIRTAMADPFFPDGAAWEKRMIARRALKRELTPTDIGGAVLFFASPHASMITGQSLNVDGGLVMN